MCGFGRNAWRSANVFTPLWNADASDWQALQEVSEWIANEDIRLLVSRVTDRGTLPDLASNIETTIAGFVRDLEVLLSDLRCDIPAAFEVDDLWVLDFVSMRDRIAAWMNGGEQLSKWVAYRDRADRGRALGCADVVAWLEDGRLAPDRIIPA
jgi:hypothetical protein